MKANRRLAGQACPGCGRPLAFGDEASVCPACGAAGHAGCPHACAAASPSPSPFAICPGCKADILRDAEVCDSCHAVLTPDGLYRGPVTNAPGAVAALVCALVGLAVLGPVLGLVAVVRAREARAAIAGDPRLGGLGLATAGLVLGIVDIILHTAFYTWRLTL
jgi:predicted amidophosphoribosyltransferase